MQERQQGKLGFIRRIFDRNLNQIDPIYLAKLRSRPPRNTEEAVIAQTGRKVRGYYVESAMGAAADFPAAAELKHDPWKIYREIKVALEQSHRKTLFDRLWRR